MARLADDPTEHTPPPEELAALASQIAGAVARIQANAARVTWLETQVAVQRRTLEGC